MGKGNFIQQSFNSGEFSELLEGRFDLDKYRSSVYKLENCILYPHGPAQNRPGFKFIHPTKDSSKLSRLIPFEFSVTQAYQLEFGDQYIRFYRDQSIITLTAQDITGITKANPAVVTYSGADTFSNSDKVIITGVEGMDEVNNREFTVANVNAGNNTFELSGIDSTGYSTYESGGEVAEIYEISSPYLEADIKEIKYCQTADVLYLFHPDYAIRKLSRTGHTAWVLSIVNFNPPAVREESLALDATLTPSHTSGAGRTFTAGAAVFQTGDVNRLIKSGAGRASITAFVSTTQVTVDIIDAFASTDAIASGSWTLEGSPSGSITPSIKSPVGSIITVNSTLNSFRSADVGKYIRVYSGFIKVTSYTNAAEVKGEIIKELTSTTATINWTLEAAIWNATNGYPSCGTFFEERLNVAGVPAYPETVWGSKVADYENFTPGTDDADSYEFTLGGRNVNIIRWLEPREYLVIGTVGSEWRLGPEDTGAGLTPLNVVAKQQTTHGCADTMPVSVSATTMFVQRAGRKIREFAWKWETERFTAPDMTILAEHISSSGIACMAYQQEPLSILWAAREDGVLVGLTYMREEEVTGWHRHPMDNGEVESLSVIPGDGYDEVWGIIKREINGSTVRYVEMMEKIFDDDADTYNANKGLYAFFVDSGLTYNGDEATVITGLWHLNGEAVSILADGAYQTPKTVANGSITLDHPASVVHIGLGYTSKIETMRLLPNLADGTSLGRVQRTSSVSVMVYRSKEFKVGREITIERFATIHRDNLEFPQIRTSDMRTGESIPLITGIVDVNFSSPFTKDNRILIVQDKPMPLTVLSIVQEVQV